MRGSGKRKAAEIFRKSKRVRESRERESAEGSENSVRIAAPAVRVLGCLTVRAFWNSIMMIFIQQCRDCRLVLPSPLALPFLIALASLRAVASLLALASLLVSADLLQGSHSQAETHTR